MKLTELNPRWVGAGGAGVTRNGQPEPARHGVGLGFDCPCGCGERVYVGLERPIDGGPTYDDPGPKWQREGDTFETITLSPSIQRIDIGASGGCRWHGFIRSGQIVQA